MIFVFDSIFFLLIDGSFISGVLRHRLHRLDLRRRALRHRDRRLLLHRDSFRHLPCYYRLGCCWLVRSFRYRRRQILPRIEKQN
jgi:hypothetical protein